LPTKGLPAVILHTKELITMERGLPQEAIQNDARHAPQGGNPVFIALFVWNGWL